MANVAVIGTGYVGLTTGAILSHLGHSVVCADVIPDKVDALNRGEVPILEDGLDELVREGLDGGRLTFVLGEATAIEEADAEFVFLCVPTPQGDDGSADLSFIEQAARAIGPVIRPESVVINKSTVPVGSTLIVERALGRGDVSVVSNPEFLREGSAVYDALNPDRIVIGSEDQAAAIRLAGLYTDIKAPVIVTDPASAETIKYASNAFLATKISFVNAIANLCEAVGADVRDVIVGMGYDRRIGFEFLKPGPGWGGSCFVGSETLLVRRGDDVRLVTFEDLAAEVSVQGVDDLEVLSHEVGAARPEFLPVKVFSERPYDGDVIEISTKMGRRLTVTADHPILVSDGLDEATTTRKLAAEIVESDWLPIVQNAPVTTPRDLGADGYSQRIPDLAWSASEDNKRSLLRGLWDGDGSWSLVHGGPGIVFEYRTESRELADGVVRLLGDLGVVSRVKIGPARPSTVDTFWIQISGSQQLEEAMFLFDESEQAEIWNHLERPQGPIEPAGYRRLSKGLAWVGVVQAEPKSYSGTVYSLEVVPTHTVVTSFGLLTSQCFPKDSRALLRIAEDNGYDFSLLQGVIDVNDEQFERMTAKVEKMLAVPVDGATVAVWGLTFKARTDDTRMSPSLEIIDRLKAKGARIKAYDPAASHVPPGIERVADPYAAGEGADVLVVLTEWDEFRWVDFEKLAGVMTSAKIVDCRNLLDPAAVRRKGFLYEGLGRP